MAGHSTRTAVLTSRIPIADVARLHGVAEQRGTTVSALIAELVHDATPALAASTEAKPSGDGPRS